MTTDTRNLIWSPTGRLCYEHLEKATASSPHTRPKFSCGLVVKQTANLIPLRNAMLSALHRKGLPASLLDELMEEMRLDDDRAGRLDANAGDLLMTARCPSRPLVEGNCANGSKCRLLVRPYAVHRPPVRYVGFDLVKVLSLGSDIPEWLPPPPDEKFSFIPTNKGDAL